MRIALVYSTRDPAGSGAARILAGMLGCSGPRAVDGRLVSLHDCGSTLLAGFSDDIIYLDYVDDYLGDWEAYVFLSRHSSASGRPTLSIHHTGNPCSEAPYGGKPRSLAVAYPRLAALLLREYRRAALEMGLLGEYQLTLEATHHGPTEPARPLVFIEIGSREEQWRDRRAQEAMAEAVYRALQASPPACTPVVGVGGTHYPETHTRLMLDKGYCYGHIFAKYTFDCIDEEIVRMAVERSADRIEGFIVLKAKSRVKKIVSRVAEELGLWVSRP